MYLTKKVLVQNKTDYHFRTFISHTCSLFKLGGVITKKLIETISHYLFVDYTLGL